MSSWNLYAEENKDLGRPRPPAVTCQVDAWTHLQKWLRKGRPGLQLTLLRVEAGGGLYWRLFWDSDPAIHGLASSYTVYNSGRIIDTRDNSVVYWEL